jgi:hypothetical protein
MVLQVRALCAWGIEMTEIIGAGAFAKADIKAAAIHTPEDLETMEQRAAENRPTFIELGKDHSVQIGTDDLKYLTAAVQGTESAFNRWVKAERILSTYEWAGFGACFEDRKSEAAKDVHKLLQMQSGQWKRALKFTAQAQAADAQSKDDDARDFRGQAAYARKQASTIASVVFSRMCEYHHDRVMAELLESDPDAAAEYGEKHGKRGTRATSTIYSKITDLIVYVQKMDPAKVPAGEMKLATDVFFALKKLLLAHNPASVVPDLVASPDVSPSVAAVQNKTHAAPLLEPETV